MERLPWELYADGLLTSKQVGAKLVLITPEGKSFRTSIRFDFSATNNGAKYEALISGLEIVMAIGVQ